MDGILNHQKISLESLPDYKSSRLFGEVSEWEPMKKQRIKTFKN